MSFVNRTTGNEAQKFLEVLLSDFQNLGIIIKNKYPQIEESCEEAITKLKIAAANPQTPVYYVVNQILFPLVQGCESKDLKIIKFCLEMIERLITQQVVDQRGARYITDTLWMLMEHSIEEVKVLQTVALLLTTNEVVHGETLAKALVLCFRLHFTKDSTTINTATGATVQQLVSLVFERVGVEESGSGDVESREVNIEEMQLATSVAPKALKPCAADAYLLFQDLIQLLKADQPYWLLGMTDMTLTFGLDLLETVLTSFSSVFFKNPEFSFLLKERVCALVIKLFSPNIKYHTMVSSNAQQAAPHDKPYFQIIMRLLRVVSILIHKYHCLLIAECEIFLSIIVKFLDPDKPSWQRSLALEVIHKMTVQQDLLISFCRYYVLKDHTTNIFQDIIISLGAFVQSHFVSTQLMGISTNETQSQPPALIGGLSVGPGSTSTSPQPGFLYRGVWLPLVFTFPIGQSKSTYLEMLDKIEPPTIPEGFEISIVYCCLLNIARSISLADEGPSTLDEEKNPPYNHLDGRQRILGCVLKVLHGTDETLSHFWPLINIATSADVGEKETSRAEKKAQAIRWLNTNVKSFKVKHGERFETNLETIYSFPETVFDLRNLNDHAITVVSRDKCLVFALKSKKLFMPLGTCRHFLLSETITNVLIYTWPLSEMGRVKEKLLIDLKESQINHHFITNGDFVVLPICQWKTIFEISNFVVDSDLVISGGGKGNFGQISRKSIYSMASVPESIKGKREMKIGVIDSGCVDGIVTNRVRLHEKMFNAAKTCTSTIYDV